MAAGSEHLLETDQEGYSLAPKFAAESGTADRSSPGLQVGHLCQHCSPVQSKQTQRRWCDSMLAGVVHHTFQNLVRTLQGCGQDHLGSYQGLGLRHCWLQHTERVSIMLCKSGHSPSATIRGEAAFLDPVSLTLCRMFVPSYQNASSICSDMQLV